MNIIKASFNALWQNNLYVFFNTDFILVLYCILFITLLLENGFLPLSFLPGDSLLILVGFLISKGKMNFFISLIVLTSASGLGYWISYIQGKWLKDKSNVIKKWFLYIPVKYQNRANFLLCHYGLYVLLFGRFISVVRTILPILSGLSRLNNIHFQIFNWLSAFFWVLVLIAIGFFLGKLNIFHQYEQNMLCILTIIPLFFLIVSLFYLLFIYYKKK